MRKDLSRYAPSSSMMVKYLGRIFDKRKMKWIKHRYVEEKLKEYERKVKQKKM